MNRLLKSYITHHLLLLPLRHRHHHHRHHSQPGPVELKKPVNLMIPVFPRIIARGIISIFTSKGGDYSREGDYSR